MKHKYANYSSIRTLRLVVSGCMVGQVLGFSCIAFADDKAANEQAKTLNQQTVTQPESAIDGPHNPHPDAQWFPEAGLGLFIHWGLASVNATGDLSWGMLANKPWTDATITPNNYYALANRWNADKLDYDKILSQAKAAGVQYAVLVTKHHDGFTLWPTDIGEIGTKHTFKGRDFVKEFTDACRKNGLKVGLYYSPPDWYFDRKYKSFSMKGPALDMHHKPTTLPTKPKDHDAKRKELVQGHVRELLNNYGKIDLIWFDGGHGEISNTEVRKLQPGIVINRRNGGAGDYGDSEGAPPKKRFKGWFETCETCWPSHKWSYVGGDKYDSAAQVIAELVGLRAWGGNLLANLGPMGDGTIPEPAINAWKEMADWMDKNKESVIGASAGAYPEDVNVPVTTRPGIAYIHFLPDFKNEVIWKNAPKPASAKLLATGAAVEFKYENGTLSMSLPADVRTSIDDVVKVTFVDDGKK